MICPNCGEEVTDGSNYCSVCGEQLWEADTLVPSEESEEETATEESLPQKIVSTVISLIICIAITLWAAFTFESDTSSYWGYNYRFPLSTHEAIVIGGGIGGFIGICVDSIRLQVLIRKINEKK